jgi:capsular exopolysaccharide synthesis family protein
VAEQIRNIRTSINFIGHGKRVKTILVTSFQPGDGKSFVSMNLAAGYSLLNKKTVLLEFDLRKPHIAKALGLGTDKGIISVLTGQLSLDDVLVKVEEFDGNFFLMPAGNLTSNAAELISGPAMSSLMKTLQERFDHIIINTPPINLVTDANLLQQYADITLIVVRQNHTSREIYTALRNRTAEYPNDPIYLLLNDVGKSRRYRGGYGYGGYEYGYGYGNKYYHEGK